MSLPSQPAPVALRTIALFEGVKGALAFAAAFGVLSLRHTDLHAATDAFLIRHGIDPETHYRRLLIESVARATNHHTGQIVALCLVYALIRFVEAYGLWRARHWAEWFAVISAGIYLPVEFQHFAHRTSISNAVVIGLNIALILYLARLLAQQRRQKHAHHPGPA